MKRKRVMVALSVFLLCLCLACGALGDALTKAQMYETGLSFLCTLEAEDVERAIAYFESAGNYGQAKLFTLYADALLKILTAEDDMSALDSAALRLKRVDREDFAQELAEQRLPSVEELRAYMNARRLEAEGRYEEAIAMYDTVGILDAFERSVELEEGYIDRQYQDAMALYEQGDYLKAAEIFRDLDWKDSAAMYRKCMELHQHEWVDATCDTPRTCSVCGATEGSALGHNWKEATCTEPRTCTRCGKTEGSALGHRWKDATCTEPKTCTRCGKTEGNGQKHVWKEATCTEPKTCSRCGATQGSALGHNWKGATCTEPKTCSRCGATQGSALGHNWKGATCTEPKTCARCGITIGKALGHDWMIATCTCERCGISREYEVPDLSHSNAKEALEIMEGMIESVPCELSDIKGFMDQYYDMSKLQPNYGYFYVGNEIIELYYYFGDGYYVYGACYLGEDLEELFFVSYMIFEDGHGWSMDLPPYLCSEYSDIDDWHEIKTESGHEYSYFHRDAEDLYYDNSYYDVNTVRSIEVWNYSALFNDSGAVD